MRNRAQKYLNALCQLAGLDRPTPVTTFRGPERSSRTVPKWEPIASHTGHRTEKAFLKYIRVTPEANARQSAGHSFFNS